ncbi:hypothetical protein AB1Y20_004534 [Prymnesium parvum]
MDDDARTLLALLSPAVERAEEFGVQQQLLSAQIAQTTLEAEQARERLLETRNELAALRAAELARAKQEADDIVAAARAEEATVYARIVQRQRRFESKCAKERARLQALTDKEEEIQARAAAMRACVAADGPDEFVELRVGGQLFETTIRSLTRFPHSVLAVLWHQHRTASGPSGPLRVDGDPSHFHLILNYLRSGKLPITKDVSQLQWLEAQAEEYKLNGKDELADLCRAQRRLNPPPQPGALSFTSTPGFSAEANPFAPKPQVPTFSFGATPVFGATAPSNPFAPKKAAAITFTYALVSNAAAPSNTFTPKPQFGAPAAPPLSFDAPAPAAGGFAGGGACSSSPFGSPAAASPPGAPAASLFGMPSATPAASAFGAAAPAPAASLFGMPSATPAASAFGAAAPAPAASLFGMPSAAPAASAFGAAAAAPAASVFGIPSAAAASSAFRAPAAAPAACFFGGGAAAPAASVFGMSSAAPAASVFGAAAAAPAASLFGATAELAPAYSLFDAAGSSTLSCGSTAAARFRAAITTSATPAPPALGDFGAGSSDGSIFGAPAAGL